MRPPPLTILFDSTRRTHRDPPIPFPVRAPALCFSPLLSTVPMRPFSSGLLNPSPPLASRKAAFTTLDLPADVCGLLHIGQLWQIPDEYPQPRHGPQRRRCDRRVGRP